MFKTIAAAVLATSLIAGPVLAQGNASPALQPQTKTSTDAKATAVKAPRHAAKVVKHRHHVKHIKRVKRMHSAKPSMHRHKHVAKHVAKQGKYLRVN